MDYDDRDVNTHLYLFELSYEDKKLLAKFEKFTNVEEWEKDKREKLAWLSNNRDKINYNIFYNISRIDNFEDIGQYVPVDKWDNISSSIIEKIDNGDAEDYNPTQFDTMVTLWMLKNKPEHFDL